MPFTQVTLINESDGDAHADVHINPVAGGEDWIPVHAPAGQSEVESRPSPSVDIVYAQHPIRKGNDNTTRVAMSGGTYNVTLSLQNDISVSPQQIVSVTIHVNAHGQGMLHAFVLDPTPGIMTVISEPMT